jgi:hypothetical protein
MSVVAGIAWDHTHLPWIAFVPIGFCALVLSLLPLTIDFREARR